MYRKTYRVLTSGLLLAVLVLNVLPGVSRAKPGASSLFDSAALDLVGQIGGITSAVATQGNYAYVGIGPRLVLFDISNPAHPRPVGQTPVFPRLVYKVAVAGD